MESRIETLPSKKLVGLNLEMSLSNNKTSELWQSFMPRRNEVKNRVTSAYISMQVYEKGQENLFSPHTVFTKWAAVEVSTHQDIPLKMSPYNLSGGKYAVFIHRGPASQFPKTMQCIMGEWFPASQYMVDDREHFEILPENYSPIDPDAREEVWIPIKNKI